MTGPWLFCDSCPLLPTLAAFIMTKYLIKISLVRKGRPSNPSPCLSISSFPSGPLLRLCRILSHQTLRCLPRLLKTAGPILCHMQLPAHGNQLRVDRSSPNWKWASAEYFLADLHSLASQVASTHVTLAVLRSFFSACQRELPTKSRPSY